MKFGLNSMTTLYKCSKCFNMYNTLEQAEACCYDVLRQKHYDQYNIQPIDFIVQVAGPEWCAGNIIKYAARYKEKNGVEDVKKAMVYCQFLINMLEGREPRDNGDERKD